MFTFSMKPIKIFCHSVCTGLYGDNNPFKASFSIYNAIQDSYITDYSSILIPPPMFISQSAIHIDPCDLRKNVLRLWLRPCGIPYGSYLSQKIEDKEILTRWLNGLPSARRFNEIVLAYVGTFFVCVCISSGRLKWVLKLVLKYKF